MESLGDRMKGYEKTWEFKLPRRMPILARVDGISFSKMTKKMKKPYDDDFVRVMQTTAESILQRCSGAILAYVQSDEISILLKNDQTFGTEPHLANKIQKLTSHLAAAATAAFNGEEFAGNYHDARFDCRVWTLPDNEINNYFLWRQQDAFRNCVQSVAHYGLKEKYGRKQSEKMMHGQNTTVLQEIIFKELDINMDKYPTHLKRGACVIKVAKVLETTEGPVHRKKWVVDKEIPIFSQDPSYVEDLYFDNVGVELEKDG